jgi:hypothetical protein
MVSFFISILRISLRAIEAKPEAGKSNSSTTPRCAPEFSKKSNYIMNTVDKHAAEQQKEKFS